MAGDSTKVSYVLKGTPIYSLANDGTLECVTTWICYDNTQDNTAFRWLAFQDDVLAWAGGVGDKWKKPTVNSGAGGQGQCMAFTDGTEFLVGSVSVNPVNRTHCEVTYTNLQNNAVIKAIGNASASIDDVNQRTKTLNYRVQVPLDSSGLPDYDGIDTHFMNSGDHLTQLGTSYLIESSSYTAESLTSYLLSFTLKDMTTKQMGIPSYSTDSYNQKTAKTTWRVSKATYESSGYVKPVIGADATAWLGLTGNSGYIVSGVEASNIGVLGYNLEITAKHVSKVFVKADVNYEDQAYGDIREVTLTYQTTAQYKDDFLADNGKEASAYGYSGYTIKSVNRRQVGVNEWEVILRLVDDNTGSWGLSGGSQSTMTNACSISASDGHFILEPEHVGWMPAVSGVDYIQINDPPKNTFTYTMDVTMLSDAGWSMNDIVASIKGNRQIGYSFIKYVNTAEKQNVPIGEWWMSDDPISIVLCDYVYAQPNETDKDNSTLKRVFKPWKASESSPIYPSKESLTDYPKIPGTELDSPWLREYVKYPVPYMSFQVTLNYRGTAQTVLSKPFEDYYNKAYKKIKNKRFSSYKGSGISTTELKDNRGKTWTAVTCSILALWDGYYWSSTYDKGAVWVEHN